jgi:hypothetical protein
MKLIREVGLLQALIDGREEDISRAIHQSTPAEDEWERRRAPERSGPTEPSPPPRPIPPAPARGVRQLLASRQSLQQAMILNEVLGPPKAMRLE